MSTVKIKTEPTATAAAAAATVDVQVKLEPSLSTGDIKLEQHTSDIDTKLESDSEADSEEDEEDDIKSENDDDDDDDDTDQNQFTITPKKQRRFICEYSGCGRGFNSSNNLGIHRHEHRLQTKLTTLGKTYTLTRQSLNDRWLCPFPGCNVIYKTVGGIVSHIRLCHVSTIKEQQQQQPPAKKARYKRYFLSVDNFYVNDIRCGYHNKIGVFICHECRLVPECLLTHLQQKHGYDEKSIDRSALPDSAVNAGADPNIDQHTSNPYLSSAINQPSQLQHQDIVRGWLCVTSDCRHCGYTVQSKGNHKKKFHQGKQLATAPALILHLLFTKSKGNYFLIIRMDQASGAVTASSNIMSQHKLDYSHDGLNTHDENDDDVSQNEITAESNQKRQWMCEYHNCGRFFSSSSQFGNHRREHKLEVVINVQGTNFVVTRQSLDDRWPCPISGCERTYQLVNGTHVHIINNHDTLLKQKRANMEDENSNQQQHHEIKKARPAIHCFKVDDFYINGTRCGYHTTTGAFICYECRLVPECLLTHLQQKHGYDEKSINSSVLSESAVNASADPNTNQHTGNSYLAPVISQSSQLHHQDIVQGWLCVTSDCGYCGYTIGNKSNHKNVMHNDEHLSTVPALVLRLFYGKSKTTCFLITRLDTIANNTVEPSHSTSQQINEVDDDDGDELVLSDYSDEDNIY